MSQFKQILGDWYWEEKKNLLVHKCSETYKSYIQQTDSEIRCLNCKKEVPQTVVDICLLCNIKTMYVFKTIEGRWGIGKYYFDSNPYLAHRCGGTVYPPYCAPFLTRCNDCNTKIPKYIIKYCKENNVGTL